MNNRTLIAISFVAFFLLAWGGGFSWIGSQTHFLPGSSGPGLIKNINATEFKEIRAAHKENIIVLDVRTDREREGGIIEGSLGIDIYESDFQSRLEELPRDQPVLIYCATGRRSLTAMRTMNSMGFEEVYNLEGGIRSWRASGGEVVKE